jgi:hypothetical protein
MVRSILAVVAGFCATGILIVGTTQGVMAAFPAAFDARGGTSSVPMLLVMHLYVALYAIFGCWLAARLAPSNPMRHALIVGALGVALNGYNVSMAWDLFPWWSNVISVATPMLWARIGGAIRQGQLARASSAAILAS